MSPEFFLRSTARSVIESGCTSVALDRGSRVRSPAIFREAVRNGTTRTHTRSRSNYMDYSRVE